MSNWTVREERPGDEAAIEAVVATAFANDSDSQGEEPETVAALRADGDLVLSLVAEEDDGIVGHAAFSPAILSTGAQGWFVLGPMSVAPWRQGQGIGRALVQAGIERLSAAGARGIVLVGDPGYYGRFGFSQRWPLALAGPLSPYFQVLSLAGEVPRANVAFAPAFARSAGDE